MSQTGIGNIYPFGFLKYLQPTAYFHRKRLDDTSVYPNPAYIPETILRNLEIDKGYRDENAMDYDLSWQAIKTGYIADTITYSEFESLPVIDNYRFIRRYFHKAWVLYVLTIRLLSFKNPYVEIVSWYRTRSVKRFKISKKPFKYPDYDHFSSDLVNANSLVSIVIPTLNRYPYLKHVLSDLESQTYKNFEVLIIDQSEPFQENFYHEFKLNIRLIYQKEKALWLARNMAIKNSKGKLILLFDDDSRIEPDWIRNHIKCLDFFNADISSGVSISKTGANVPENYSFFRVSDQLDTGNVLIKKEVFYKIGLFDRQFEKQRMGDGEFGLRAYLAGFLNISNPFSKRLHLKVGSGGLREMGSWDAFRPTGFFDPRPVPSVLYYFRKYYGNSLAKLA
ncbi:MAG: glycosyltransferase family 2 protein, partial [Bacteroidia bacterium]|nr:glycosyltransferase family 2 protein [Bacteroidia bacterium]